MEKNKNINPQKKTNMNPRARAAAAARRRARQKKLRRQRMIKRTVIACFILLIIAAVFYMITVWNSDDDVSLPVPTQSPTEVPSFTEVPVYTDLPVSVVTMEPTFTPEPTNTPEPTPTPVPTQSPPPVKLDYDYFIEVDKDKQIITVYTLGETGYYDLICKQFICSTGKLDKVEDGMYRIGEQYRWKQMGNGSYAQYASRISGPYLFHSCVYYTEKINQLKQNYYLNLGKKASSGCIRLTAGDAYWIYTHCKKGTPIHVFASGETDDELKNSLWHPKLVNINYDPTDPEAPEKYRVTPYPEPTPDPTPAYGVTPAPTPKWTVHPELKAWGYN